MTVMNLNAEGEKAAPATTSVKTSLVLASCLSGWMGSLGATAILQPLDVIRTRMISSTSCEPVSMVRTIKSLSQESMFTFFNGLTPALLRISIGSACYFTTQSYLLQSIEKMEGKPTQALDWRMLLIGGFSRGVAVIAAAPITVLKTRCEAAGLIQHRLTLRQQWQIVHTNKAYFAGLPYSLLKDCTFASLFLMSYVRLKREFVLYHLSYDAAAFFAAFSSGALCTCVLQPFEVMKTKLQLTVGSSKQFQSSLSLIQEIVHERGMKGFFVGVTPKIIRRSFSQALSWSFFERVYRLMTKTSAV